MKPEHWKFGNDQEFICDLTRKLDFITGTSCINFRHYILIDDIGIRDKCFLVRIPGKTVGAAWIDDNNVITEINIDGKPIITYPDDVNEIVKQFIGETIDEKNKRRAKREQKTVDERRFTM